MRLHDAEVVGLDIIDLTTILAESFVPQGFPLVLVLNLKRLSPLRPIQAPTQACGETWHRFRKRRVVLCRAVVSKKLHTTLIGVSNGEGTGHVEEEFHRTIMSRPFVPTTPSL